jgi:replication factor A1
MATTEQAFFPISEISTYHPQWKIRARITAKAPLRTFSKSNNPNGGKVFSVDLLDAEGGEIRASFFNEAADKFYNKLEKGKCYTMSKGGVRVANKQYNACKHRYELIFDKLGEVEEVNDDGKIDAVRFSFTTLRAVQSQTLPCAVDLCGIITAADRMYSFTSKDGKELVKREITIADDTATSISVTLWGDRAKQEDSVFEGNPVACIKGVLVKEWNGGRSGSLLESGAFMLNPAQYPEAKKAQQWWSEGGGSSQNLTAISVARGQGGGGRTPTGKQMDVTEMRSASEQVGDQQEVYTVHARLALVQMEKKGEPQPLYYMACQEPKSGNNLPCNRRVDSSGFCAACNRAGKAAPRLNVRCRFADHGDSCWLTTFHEPAQKVLDLTGEQCRELEQGPGGREAVEKAVRSRFFSDLFQVTVRAKLDNYNGEARTNISCIDARPVSKSDRGRAMLKEVHEMLAAGGA